MSEATEEKAPAAPAGIPMKMVIIIVAGVLVLGLGGAFAMFKMMGGPSGAKAHGESGMPVRLPTWTPLSSTLRTRLKFVTSK